MFITGIMVGTFLGCAVGVLVTSICVIAKRGDALDPCADCVVNQDPGGDRNYCFDCARVVAVRADE